MRSGYYNNMTAALNYTLFYTRKIKGENRTPPTRGHLVMVLVATRSIVHCILVRPLVCPFFAESFG